VDITGEHLLTCEPPADAHGFLEEFAAKRQKSGAETLGKRFDQ